MLIASTTGLALDPSHPPTYMPALECYHPYGKPQKCLPEFENAAYEVQIEATNTCGDHGEKEFCEQSGNTNEKSCDECRRGQYSPRYLTDLHDPQNPTWWQSETMFEGIQHPNQVNLTLHLGKSFDITYIRIVFHSPRPESFAIYKRVSQNGPWMPYQFYSASCRYTYGMPDSLSIKKGEDESRALCTSEYSDISPLRDGNIAFSSLEGRPSATNFENSIALQNWVTATDIRITLDRLNTFGDEVFGDKQVLRSYFYAIADIAVGARCKCNGHASKCVASTGLNGERTRVCECKHNTDGPDCERCLPYYNDVEWKRATSKDVNECKPCNCNGYSEKCFFDRHLFNETGHGGHCLDCRDNRDGANCEKCKDNYYMRDDGHCVNCACDSVGSLSLQCNAEGRCTCKRGVTGDKCDRCEANFYQFGPHGCQPCGCDPRGSLDNTPSCDPETGICSCKENVEGRHCKECKPGFFNLDLQNRFGCTPCFCYGHTSECQSAEGYSIVSTTSNFNKHLERWRAMDDRDNKVDVKYNQFSQSIGTIANGRDFVYFVAPDRFLGDQRASYNRLFKFKLQLNGQIGPNPSPLDVILEGAGTQISLPIFAQDNGIPDGNLREFVYRLHEHSNYSWQPSQSSRGFMSILSNLTAIKIRASYSSHGEAVLDDVELETAHRDTAGNSARWIEQCSCPEGYLGQFCESCAPGYRHSPSKGGPFMPCIPCDCNKHATICDSETGRCICQHNTAGDTCNQCAKGYYGNALIGTPDDCKPCNCRGGGACFQMPDDSVVCFECPSGYAGSKCEDCSDGYYGDPAGVLGEERICKPCDCNGNVDPNAVGNCNRTTGQCLKCIYNTAGENCNECLPGYFGDPLALPHGSCEQCSCYPPGTEQTEDGISICDQLSGNCKCKPNVIGHNCNECQPGYFNIVSGNGCENCYCDPVGSYNSTCDRFTGQCFCKEGVTGLRCDQCATYQYGFSAEGCKPCDCDESGSKGFQCDEYGQCPCNDNVEGRQCNRCKENKYDRHQGCIDCPPCYDLVQDATNAHRSKLANLSQTLDDIAKTPVTNDEEFESKLRTVQEKLNILLDDAKAGAGGGDRTLVERLQDLRDRLDKVQEQLDAADKLHADSESSVKKSNETVTEAKKFIEDAQNEITAAFQRLRTDGTQALQRAREKASKLGSQSEQISKIARDSRRLADEFEATAEEDRKNAKEANETAFKAYELAKSSLNLQKNISDELRSEVELEMSEAKLKLASTAKQTKEALEKATAMQDAALTLLADVEELVTPQVDVAQLKKDATEANQEAKKLKTDADELGAKHDELLADFDEELTLAEVLIERDTIQKMKNAELLEEAKMAYDEVQKAVAQGDGVLKDANNTYHTLAGFQSQVQKSSAEAQKALETVAAIEEEIQSAEKLTREAEEALAGAKDNAEEARKNAQEAQEVYAEQASKEAEEIRKKANATKENARKLRGEADQLNGRVAVTENNIQSMEDKFAEDENLVEDAKKKVGEAQSNAEEAQTKVKKALQEVKAIMDDLDNLGDINMDDLDKLETRLDNVEESLRNADIEQRLETLIEMKTIQNKWIAEYEKEIKRLEVEVTNIQAIANALPPGCFKRTHLEP